MTYTLLCKLKHHLLWPITYGSPMYHGPRVAFYDFDADVTYIHLENIRFILITSRRKNAIAEQQSMQLLSLNLIISVPHSVL